MATEKNVSEVFTSVEKAFLQASLELKIAQVRRAIAAEADAEVVRIRRGHVVELEALQHKIRSL